VVTEQRTVTTALANQPSIPTPLPNKDGVTTKQAKHSNAIAK